MAKTKTATLQDLPRSKVRYWCFRFKTEEDGGADASDAPKGLKKLFEDMRWFTKWTEFGITWDVDENDAFDIVPLKTSLEEQWNTEAMASMRELPVPEVEPEVSDDGS